MDRAINIVNGFITINFIQLEGFSSLSILQIVIGNNSLYSISNLYKVLGYKSQSGLSSLFKNTRDYVYTLVDIYSIYLAEDYSTYSDPISYKDFTDELVQVFDRYSLSFSKSTGFLDKNGVLFSLSHNTMCSDRVKVSLCKAIGISNEIICPSRPETTVYEYLSKLITPFGLKLYRQYSIGKYRADLAVVDDKNYLKCVIEFDEEAHRWYNKESEESRSSFFHDNNIKLFRIKDLDSVPFLLKSILSL